MLKPILKFNPRNHIFKAAGAVIGLITMGFFGLLFGLIGGALIDQLTKQLLRKKRLKRFLINPASVGIEIKDFDKNFFIEASALSTAFYLCFADHVKTELLLSSSQLYFPAAPVYTAECLRELNQPDFRGLAEFFGSNAAAGQKKALSRMINSIELKPSILRTLVEDPRGSTAYIITAADFFTPDPPHSADYDILGLAPEASKEEIKHVYYKLAAHFHPDAGCELSPEQRKITEDAFKIIKDAYERIK